MRLWVFGIRIEVGPVCLQVAIIPFGTRAVRFRVWPPSVGKPVHTILLAIVHLPILPLRFRVSPKHLHLYHTRRRLHSQRFQLQAMRLRLLATTLQLGA